MAQRLSLGVLADWAQGRLDPARGEVVERAIADDAGIASAASWVTGFLHTAREVPLEEPPAGLHDRLCALFDRPDDDGPDGDS